MIVNLKPDECQHYKFFKDWIVGKRLAVHDLTTPSNATARNRLSYCRRKGYTTLKGWDERNQRLSDLYEINTSAKERQGKPMNPAYFDPVQPILFNEQCKFHHVEWYGVQTIGWKLVGYVEAYFIGEMVNISRILGHADYLKDGIMLLLIEELISDCVYQNVKAVVYNEWDSGTAGLQYFKHSTGFREMELTESI